MKDDKELEQKKLAFVLYGILWLIGLMIAGAFGYQKHTQDGASIFAAYTSDPFWYLLLVKSGKLGYMLEMDVYLLDWCSAFHDI